MREYIIKLDNDGVEHGMNMIIAAMYFDLENKGETVNLEGNQEDDQEDEEEDGTVQVVQAEIHQST